MKSFVGLLIAASVLGQNQTKEKAWTPEIKVTNKWVGVDPGQKENNTALWGLKGTQEIMVDEDGLLNLRITSIIEAPEDLKPNHVY